MDSTRVHLVSGYPDSPLTPPVAASTARTGVRRSPRCRSRSGMTEHTLRTDLTAAALNALLSEWQLALRAENRSPGTIEVYTDGARRYLNWCESTDIAPMVRTSLHTWMAQMPDAGEPPRDGADPTTGGKAARRLAHRHRATARRPLHRRKGTRPAPPGRHAPERRRTARPNRNLHDANPPPRRAAAPPPRRGHHPARSR